MVIHQFKVNHDTGEVTSLSVTPVIEFWDELDPVPEVLSKAKAIGSLEEGQLCVMLRPDLKDKPDEVAQIVKALAINLSVNQ